MWRRVLLDEGLCLRVGVAKARRCRGRRANNANAGLHLASLGDER
jgi:hypothetical protein